MIRRAGLLVTLMRPAVTVILTMFAVVGMSGAAGQVAPLTLGRVLVVVMAGLVFAATTNDLSDEAIDRINLAGDRRRPLVVGTGTRFELKVMAGVAAGVALSVAATLGWWPLAIATGGLALSACYSLRPVRVADRGVVAPLFLPACYVAVPYLVGALSVRPGLSGRQVLLLVGLYLGFVGRIVLKDFRDATGDALFGKRTFLVRHGRRAAVGFAAAFWASGAGMLTLASGALPWSALYAAMACGALSLLWLLAGTSDPGREERLIAALAIVGRGSVALVWIHLETTQARWPSAGGLAFAAAFCLITLGQGRAMATLGPRRPTGRPKALVTAGWGAAEPERLRTAPGGAGPPLGAPEPLAAHR